MRKKYVAIDGTLHKSKKKVKKYNLKIVTTEVRYNYSVPVEAEYQILNWLTRDNYDVDISITTDRIVALIEYCVEKALNEC